MFEQVRKSGLSSRSGSSGHPSFRGRPRFMRPSFLSAQAGVTGFRDLQKALHLSTSADWRCRMLIPKTDAGRTPGIMHFAPAWQLRALLVHGYSISGGLSQRRGVGPIPMFCVAHCWTWSDFKFWRSGWGPVRSRQDPSDRHGSIWVHCVIPPIPLGDGSFRLGFRLGFHQNRDRTRHDTIEGCLHRFLYPSIIPPGGGQGFGVHGFGLFLGFLGRPEWSSPHSSRRRPGILQ